MRAPRSTIGQAVEETPEHRPDPADPAEQAGRKPPRRKRTWYSLADVLLRRFALAAFVVIALIATIVAALGRH